MPLQYACIAPHGDVLSDPDRGAITRQTLTGMGDRLQPLNLDTLIVLTPHGVRIDGQICVSVAERAEGSLPSGWPSLFLSYDIDQPLAGQICDEAIDAEIPIARCIFGASAGPSCTVPLDWGSIVPLHFLAGQGATKPRVVIICPTRSLPNVSLYAFGQIIARVAARAPGKVGLIASADQGHAHKVGGPYGFDPASSRYDQIMQDMIRENQLDDLLAFDEGLLQTAKADSYWQTLILAGALSVTPMRGELLSYEVMDYFGMLCAGYRS